MSEKKIMIVGDGNAGKKAAIEILSKTDNTTVVVKDSTQDEDLHVAVIASVLSFSGRFSNYGKPKGTNKTPKKKKRKKRKKTHK